MKLRSGRLADGRESANQPNDARERSPNRPKPVSAPLKSPAQISAQDAFNALYKDLVQPGSYSSKLLKYLRKNVTHSLHKTVRHKFPRRRIVTHYMGQIVQTDLIDMQKYSGSNSGFNYILVLIDCFSKKLFVEPLKTKRGDETANALRKIFQRITFPIQTLIFDEGLEYKNKFVNFLLAEFNVHSYHIKSKLKASTAERVNKTIKAKIWKIFTETKKKRWIDILPKVVENYNRTFHKSIKMSPDEVTWDNRKKVFKTMFPEINSVVKCRLREGDKVRIALNKDIFDKGYTVNWSEDVFTIIGAFQKNGVCWYRLEDSEGKVYPKIKYFYQLNLV